MHDRKSWLNWFDPVRQLTPHEGFQVRFLAGAAVIGLFTAIASVAAARAAGQRGPELIVASFGVCCVALLLAIRAGAPVAVLRYSGLALVSCFLVVETLQTIELDWAAMKWLVLLPMLSVFLSEARTTPGAARRSGGALWRGTALAIFLGGFIVFANRMGWTAQVHESATTVRGVELGPFIDFVLFALSVSGLMSVHSLAHRRMEEELVMLRSMLCICAWCRRIRDDEDGWITTEHYMAKRDQTRLTHGICPECAKTALAETK